MLMRSLQCGSTYTKILELALATMIAQADMTALQFGQQCKSAAAQDRKANEILNSTKQHNTCD